MLSSTFLDRLPCTIPQVAHCTRAQPALHCQVMLLGTERLSCSHLNKALCKLVGLALCGLFSPYLETVSHSEMYEEQSIS